MTTRFPPGWLFLTADLQTSCLDSAQNNVADIRYQLPTRRQGGVSLTRMPCTRLESIARAWAVLIAFIAALILAPTNAEAHATVVSSYPEPGQQVGATPGVVVLQFSEPINSRLSRASVASPDGQRFSGTASDPHQIQVRLKTNAPGIYRVDWTTVSVVDGHTLRGSFEFGVGVAPNDESTEETRATPRPFDLLIALARAIEDAALLLAVGGIALRRLAYREPALPWVRPPVAPVLVVALVAGIAVVVAESLNAAPSPSPSAVIDYLGTGPPGAARVARIVAEVIALIVATVSSDLAVVPVVIAIFYLASAGHAAAVRPAWWGIAADTIHLVAAGLWAGGILALVTVRPPSGWRESLARDLLGRFTPVALGAFAVTVAFGALRGTQELTGISDLWTSSYGQVLSAKIVAVVGMVGLSLRAWRWRLVLPRVEASLAALVIVAAALLAAFPLPPARVSEATAAAEQPPPNLALPRPGDLTLAATASDVVVGMTIRPGRPGANEMLLYLLPVQGEADAGAIPVTLSVDGRAVGLFSCGSGCRQASVNLAGGERVEVNLAGEKDAVAKFQLPHLPAPDGSNLLRSVQQRMHALKTYRIDESLGPASPPVQTSYFFQAPNRMRIASRSGFESLWIGPTRYNRDRPGQPWQKEDLGFAPNVPEFSWDVQADRDYIAPRIIGDETVDGVHTDVLSFFIRIGELPVWFRLSVDSSGLVRHAEMLTQGHFMEHRYVDFDTPMAIEPPIQGTPGSQSP